MPESKSKSKSVKEVGSKWSNQVVRTANGRLLVRGVDVPTSGKAGEWVLKSGSSGQRMQSLAGSVLTQVTSKSQALATAKRAGMGQSVKAVAGSAGKPAVRKK